MDLLAAWLLYPLIALVVALGIGLLAERASGERVPGALLAPLGLAGVVGASQLTTYWNWSAELTVPLVVVLAIAGWILGFRRIRRPDPWPLAAALGVAAVFGAPVVLSGEATFAGYTVLGDTSIHMIGADALLAYGRDFSHLPPSSYEFALFGYYGGNAYPSGGPTAAGVLTRLAFQDVAWTFQPFLTLLAAGTALALWRLLGEVIGSKPLRALATFVAGQPALMLAYALQGSVKEVGTAFGITLVAALIPVYVAQRGGGARRAIPLGVAAGATVAIVGTAAAVWLAPLMLGAVVWALLARPRAWKPVLGASVVFLGVMLVLGWQMFKDLFQYVEVAGSVVTAQQELGNLLGPLDPLSKYGTWLTGDYRMPPTGTKRTLTELFVGVTVALLLVGVYAVVRLRAIATGLFLVVSAVAYVYVVDRGSPWADGKAMMIVGPAVLLGAMAGAGMLARLVGRAAGYALVGVVAFGVLWSNALAYHDVSLAPRDRLAELERIGDRFHGQGPTLFTEFEEWTKHFLRDMAPEGPSDGWQRRFELSRTRSGDLPRFGFAQDLDAFTERYVLHYRTIVMRRGPLGSRPPAPYRRVYSGTWYDVWQRPADGNRRVVRHVPLGDLRTPWAELSCTDARALGRRARRDGLQLAMAPRTARPTLVPSLTAFPPAWFKDPTDQLLLRPVGQGRIEDSVDVPRAGTYELWIEGSIGRGFDVLIDGRKVDTVRYRLNGRGTLEPVARVRLDAGRHVITLLRGGGSLRPGNGGINRNLGIVALVAEGDPPPVETLPPDRWRELCGRPLDWVALVRRA